MIFVGAGKSGAGTPCMHRAAVGSWTVCPFYKGESQEKYFPGDWKERCVPSHDPARVKKEGSWDLPVSEFHFCDVTTLAVLYATKATWFRVPTIVLSETHGL